MWQRLFPAQVTDDDRDRFVITPHHPDRLRRPVPSLTATPDARFHQALAWNVFRTLELVSPAFWLRRFHIRLTGEPPVVPAQIAQVHLWPGLPLPPLQRIDGDRPTVVPDVVIETEHAVWTLIGESAEDVTGTDRTAAVVDAAAWFAGARQHYCGVLASSDTRASLGPLLRTRYARSRESARLRSATRGPASPTDVQWGAVRWSELAALLEDCCGDAHLPPIERALAGNALEWLARVGVSVQGSSR